MVQGVSNEFRDGVDAAISVKRGTLIVTFPIEVALPQVSRFHEFGGDIGELDTEVSSCWFATLHAARLLVMIRDIPPKERKITCRLRAIRIVSAHRKYGIFAQNAR